MSYKKDNFPLISIITVVYNGAETLEQTIQSVISQTYDNIEYIIIDGGSTDGTLDIIKKYENHIDQWLSEPDEGLYDAMNKGIARANGELIGMINSDDWYEHDAVKLIVEAYRKNPDKKIFHGDRYDIHENGKRNVRKFHPSTFKFLYYGMTYNHPSMFIHNKIYDQQKYNVELKIFADYEFILEQFMRSREQFFYINKAYVNYRLDGISTRLSFKRNIKENLYTRKSAGMNVLQILFAAIFNTVVTSIIKLSRKVCQKIFL